MESLMPNRIVVAIIIFTSEHHLYIPQPITKWPIFEDSGRFSTEYETTFI